jgi:hypothetical protein
MFAKKFAVSEDIMTEKLWRSYCVLETSGKFQRWATSEDLQLDNVLPAFTKFIWKPIYSIFQVSFTFII